MISNDIILEKCMEQHRKALLESCEKPHQCIPVREISMALTNRCNCYCVMCPFTSADTKKIGVLTDDGHTISLEEAKQILAMRIGRGGGETYRGKLEI